MNAIPPWPRPIVVDTGGGPDPIGHLIETHGRMKTVGAHISCIGDDLWHRGRETSAALVLAFLEEDLPAHLDDERFSLLPRLRWRLSGTVIAEALMKNIEDRMRHDHDMIGQLVQRVTGGLATVGAGSVPEHPAFFAVELIRLELQLRQHMAWEEAFVFPLAREHLTPDDLRKMSREIAARRGAPPA